jgi:alpha-L-fucosidase
MSAQNWNRRNFLKASLTASSLPLFPRFAFGADEQNDDERTAWYRDAKFGMFIHWGPYSLASVEASWPIMVPKPEWKITEAEYRALPQQFNPVKFDPDAFVDLARTAGQQYMVFTTKHHDGFCMFDSSYTDHKITKTPYGKDIVKMLADACSRRNMRLGFYYSPPDLTHPGFRDTSKLARDNWRGEPWRPEWPTYLQYMQLQLSELLTKYGPAVLVWFDGLNNQEKYDGERFIRLIRSLQSETLVNDRIGVPGDYVTPEQFIPKAIPTKLARVSGLERDNKNDPSASVPDAKDFQLWETCMTINDTWAYNAHDHNYKSAQTLIRGLVEVTSRGGNFLLNVGPQPDGVLQPEFQERLRAIGDWMAVNSDAIYGTTYGPVQGSSAFRTTAKRETVYVHVFDWPSSSLEISGVKAKVISANMLANGQALKFRQSENGLSIDVPALAPDTNATVIALRTL